MLRALSLPGRSFAVAALVALAACSNDGTSISQPLASADSIGTMTTESLGFAAYTSPIMGATFYVDPYSNAMKTATAWRTTRPLDAAQMDKIANTASAKWIGSWNTNVQSDVNTFTTAMSANGATPVFVAYNIPQRDCGGLSGGNTTSANAYKTWISGFAAGIGSRKAIVILEPDALAQMDCLSSTDQQLRLSLMNYAVNAFKAKGNIAVYLDAGNPRWKSASTIGQRLISAGIANATGFSLNVSNFYTTADNINYGTQVSYKVGGRHFVIDTGRNGLGPTADYQWCNPSGRALGNKPTTQTGNALVDAFLWIKTPGESDGACNGNPSAGAWMPDYALGLAQRAAY
jgi:endoglucanase